jgi:hypothetical protein
MPVWRLISGVMHLRQRAPYGRVSLQRITQIVVDVAASDSTSAGLERFVAIAGSTLFLVAERFG